MKIAVISDTHLTHVTADFRHYMEKFFSSADIMVHAGDMTSSSVYDYLSNWDIRAVYGNMDDYSLRAYLPERRVEEIAGRRIGIIHGWGSPRGLENAVFGEFRDVDIIIFGHSHMPLNLRKGSVVLFNPGSYRGGYSQKGTVGIIEIEDDITFRHITVE